jgi:hypothetical protein
VPDEVAVKIEFEVEDDNTEFEIELTGSRLAVAVGFFGRPQLGASSRSRA